jgi:hypothetical protein
MGAQWVTVTIEAEGSSGLTEWPPCSRETRAAVAVAARVWFETFRVSEWPGKSGSSDFGSDMRMLEENADDIQAREAMATAFRILRDHRRDVLALASRLERERKVTLGPDFGWHDRQSNPRREDPDHDKVDLPRGFHCRDRPSGGTTSMVARSGDRSQRRGVGRRPALAQPVVGSVL